MKKRIFNMVTKLEIIKEISTAGGKLTYQLIKSDEMSIGVYGMKIVSSLFETKEETIISDVTCDIERGEALFALCIENNILPSVLGEFCMDFIMSEPVLV
jgi:hypothetical protein